MARNDRVGGLELEARVAPLAGNSTAQIAAELAVSTHRAATSEEHLRQEGRPQPP